jgi:hypothetical protein
MEGGRGISPQTQNPNSAYGLITASQTQARSQGGPKGAVPPPAKCECPLANVNGQKKKFGLRNVNVYVKMIELRVHVKSNLFTTKDC